jgi:hypothetical protein
MNSEDLAEAILTATLPGSPMYESSQTDFAIQDAGLACAGMPRVWYMTLCYRILGDERAYAEVSSRLAAMALCSPHRPVRVRAGLLASLVMAEDRSSGLIEKIGLIPPLLRISRSQYYRDIRPTHQNMRARLDDWARSGIGYIAGRVRG